MCFTNIFRSNDFTYFQFRKKLILEIKNHNFSIWTLAFDADALL